MKEFVETLTDANTSCNDKIQEYGAGEVQSTTSEKNEDEICIKSEESSTGMKELNHDKSVIITDNSELKVDDTAIIHATAILDDSPVR